MKLTKGAIINGKYIRNYELKVSIPQSTYKQAEHQKQRDRHARDILQPFINFKANPEFIKEYPEESKKYFTDEQIKKTIGG